MSGGLLERRASGILVWNCSFWIGSILIVTFGLARWKSAATPSQTFLSGSVVPLCHQVSVTGPVSFFVAPELPPLLPPQAASATAAMHAASTSAPPIRELRMSASSSSDGLFGRAGPAPDSVVTRILARRGP